MSRNCLMRQKKFSTRWRRSWTARSKAMGRPQTLATNPSGRYRLFRVGDAVAGRNIHAALYDALRLCKDL
jgi:hypothetical protein